MSSYIYGKARTNLSLCVDCVFELKPSPESEDEEELWKSDKWTCFCNGPM